MCAAPKLLLHEIIDVQSQEGIYMRVPRGITEDLPDEDADEMR
jgi:hypothetical protein